MQRGKKANVHLVTGPRSADWCWARAPLPSSHSATVFVKGFVMKLRWGLKWIKSPRYSNDFIAAPRPQFASLRVEWSLPRRQILQDSPTRSNETDESIQRHFSVLDWSHSLIGLRMLDGSTGTFTGFQIIPSLFLFVFSLEMLKLAFNFRDPSESGGRHLSAASSIRPATRLFEFQLWCWNNRPVWRLIFNRAIGECAPHKPRCYWHRQVDKEDSNHTSRRCSWIRVHIHVQPLVNITSHSFRWGIGDQSQSQERGMNGQ